ncbi:MAG TPA: hypothetical protein VKB67_09845 [Rhizomicrobium sp.]|nr:hypothetical protein [Rhizomicrobium sp.]
MPKKLGFAALSILLMLVGCGKPQQHTDPLPSLDDQAKLLQLQKICAEQAAQTFRAANYLRKANVINSYASHYSAKLGRCFILVTIFDSTDAENVSTFETIEDAFEGRRLGTYFVPSARDEKAGTHVATCEERAIGELQKSCGSRIEWDAYKARYMDAP